MVVDDVNFVCIYHVHLMFDLFKVISLLPKWQHTPFAFVIERKRLLEAGKTLKLIEQLPGEPNVDGIHFSHSYVSFALLLSVWFYMRFSAQSLCSLSIDRIGSLYHTDSLYISFFFVKHLPPLVVYHGKRRAESDSHYVHVFIYINIDEYVCVCLFYLHKS